jgi:hypothetical protein
MRKGACANHVRDVAALLRVSVHVSWAVLLLVARHVCHGEKFADLANECPQYIRHCGKGFLQDCRVVQ